MLLAAFPLNGDAKPFGRSPNASFDTKQFLETIDGQILALREKNISKAYYIYTSSEFRKQTSLKTFARSSRGPCPAARQQVDQALIDAIQRDKRHNSAPLEATMGKNVA